MNEITRRDLLKSAGLGAAALALPGCLGRPAAGDGRAGSGTRGGQPKSGAVLRGGSTDDKAARPNFILIMADDLGYGDLGCYGNGFIRTPNLDALAAGGVRFTDFHSNGAVCSPTRAALLTGRYQQRCGIEGVVTAKNHRRTGMALGETTFAEVLKSRDYATGLFGKWHLGYEAAFNPVRQGFDTFRGFVSGNVDYHAHIDQEGFEDWWKDADLVPEEGYATDLVTAQGVRFIEENRDRAFCLYLPHGAPHYPLQGREDPPVRAPGYSKASKGSGRDKGAVYREMIEVLDEGIGRIVDTVNRLGLADRTFLFFCSDNGPAGQGSSGPLRGKKGSLWEGGHRVPALAYWPGKIEGGKFSGRSVGASAGATAATVMGMDLFPTMASLAGAKRPPGLALDGVDLAPLLLRGEDLPERTLFWRHGKTRALRKGPWKLLVDQKMVHLFNLDDDLGEKKNLARKMPGKAKTLNAELVAWEAEVSAGVERRA